MATVDNTSGIAQSLLLLSVNPAYRKLYAYYESDTIFDVLGVARSENKHSNFLQWIFLPSSNHDIGFFAVARLLTALVEIKSGIQSSNTQMHWELDADLEAAITDGTFLLEDIHCLREVVLGPKARIDLQIDCTVLYDNNLKSEQLTIFIENKVTAKESKEQTATYYNLCRDRPNKKVFVFLSPVPSIQFEKATQPLCSCKKYIGLNYQKLLNAVLEPCLSKCNEKARYILSEYIRTLGKPALQHDNNASSNGKGELIMAISENERQLLNDFWDANEEIMMAIIAARSTDPAVSEEQRTALGVVVEGERRKHMKVTYTFYGVTKTNTSGVEFLRDVVDNILQRYPHAVNCAIEALNFLQDTPPAPDTRSIFRKYEKLVIDGRTIFVATSTDNETKVQQAASLINLICDIDSSVHSADILCNVTLRPLNQQDSDT